MINILDIWIGHDRYSDYTNEPIFLISLYMIVNLQRMDNQNDAQKNRYKLLDNLLHQ